MRTTGLIRAEPLARVAARDTMKRWIRRFEASSLRRARVAVTQQIAARNYTWTTAVRGTVVDFAQQETGSWFAHSKDDASGSIA